MRLFIAVKLNREMKALVRNAQDAFRQQGVRGNYTREENLHITLAFIGEYDDPEEVLEAMETVSFTPFDICMNRIGCFDTLWWAGLAESRELESLAGKLRHAFADAGIPFDRKKFKAHVTFLRKPVYGGHAASGSAGSAGARRPHIDVGSADMRVERISLMQSARGKNGMIYTEIGSVSAG